MLHAKALRFWGLGLLPPFAVGFALRWIGIRAQVLTDDELHTVGAVLAMPLGEIVRNITYEGADYCVPLTALFRIAMDNGVVFSEMGFRVPSLLAGLIALVAIPTLLAPRIGQRAASVCAWLLAISPLLVLYSRIVRPYMAATLLAFCAVMSFDIWLRSRSRRSGIAYLLFATGAVYLHLGTGPLVLAPFGYLAFTALRRGFPKNELRQAAGLLAATSVAIAIPLLPAMNSLVALTQIRRDGQLPELASWLEVVQLHVGTPSLPLAAAAMGFVLYGAAQLRKRNAAFAGLIATVAALHVLGLLLLSPDRMQEASVLARYLLVLLPFGLMGVAVALSSLLELAPSGPKRLALGLSIAAFAALLFATGPLSSDDYRASAFTHTPSFLRISQPPDWIPDEKVPRFYHELAGQDGSDAIIEHPWMSQASHPIAAYQNVHRRPVLTSSLVEGYFDSRLDLKNVLMPTEEDFLDSPAQYLVVHFDLHAEAVQVVTGDPHQQLWLKARRQLWEPLRRSGNNTTTRLTRSWGKPAYADSTIQVWDLQALRLRQGRLN